MPDGVSGDWETMISRAYMFLTIGRQLAKAATTAADHVPDGTPEERARDRSARRGHLPDSESCDSATRRCDWRIPPAGAGTGHSQRQPDPAFGATSKRDTPVQAHFSSVPATPESRGAGTGDVSYQGPDPNWVRDKRADTSAALVMWIASSNHITTIRHHRHELSATSAWSMTALGFQQAAFTEPAGQQRRTYRRQRAAQPAWYARCGRGQFVRRTPRSGENILCILPLGT